MSRPQYRNPDRQACAHLLVASLLEEVNHPSFPGHDELHRLNAVEKGIEVKASPDALCALISHFIATDRLAVPKKEQQAFIRLKLKQRDTLRDTITDMGKERLGFTDELPRPRGNPNKVRSFHLKLRFSPDQITENLEWLFGKNGLWQQHLNQQKKGFLGGIPKDLFHIIDQAVSAFPGDLCEFTPSYCLEIESLLPFLHTALDSSLPCSDLVRPKIALNLGKFYLSRGSIALAYSLLQKCLELNKKDPLGKANAHHYLAICYIHCEDYGAAEKNGQYALKLREKISDNSHNIAATLHVLAKIYLDQGEKQKAMEYLDRAIISWSDTPFSLARGMQLKGEILLRDANFKEAESCFTKAISLLGKPTELNVISIGECHRGLARVHALQKSYLRACDFWKEALETIEKFNYDRHPLMALLNADIGGVYFLMGDRIQARKHYQKAKEDALKIYGDKHSVVLGIGRDLSVILNSFP